VSNETLEDRVLEQKKGKSKRVFLIIAGLFILGIVSMYGGMKIFSKLSISASTDEPPIPPDPLVSVTVTSSTEPPVPPDPSDPTLVDVEFPSGWSMVSGSILASRNLTPISNAGIYLYSFNDPNPGLQNRNWVVSNPDIAIKADYSPINSSLKIWPHPALGYYAYNPSGKKTLSLSKITSTRPDSQLIFARGWHLMYWSDAAATKDDLLKKVTLNYNDQTKENLMTATGQNSHKASIKIYVVTHQSNISSASVKELTGQDSSTTISKIPANSFYWVYLRRTKSRVIDVTHARIPSTTSPTSTSTSKDSAPPVPPTP